ncbi:MAG: outer membrane lipoprotein-sorting protein [Myxococcales bacterium]|nr:outer membrane lipoprotein-sorting protein [Myxococcales bacterium]
MAALVSHAAHGQEPPKEAEEKPAEAPAKPLDAAGVKAVIKQIDDRQKNSGDYKTLVYIERKEKTKNDVVMEAVVYRRDADDKLMILFTQPKSERGKGYLRIERNLWMYDPGTGKWERRTERERIGGTDSRRADFDESRLAEEFDATYEGIETLGKISAHKLTLTVKKGVDVAYPKIMLWCNIVSGNVLKRQEFAASGKLMRTNLTPKWAKRYSESKKGDVWTPKTIYIYDEVEKGNSTVIVLKDMDLRPLQPNLFTKAWLESQSR